MAGTQVFTIGSLPIAAAPPVFHLPSDAGVAVPVGKSAWTLDIDLGAPVPVAQTFAIAIEYQRNAWTDNAGIAHPAGEWLQDATMTCTTGTFMDRTGSVTSVHPLSSTIGAINGSGGMVEPYPTHARTRIDTSGSWTLPSVSLTLF